MATAGEISPAYAIVKQGISTKHHLVPEQANTARGVARGVKNQKVQVANVHAIPTLK